MYVYICMFLSVNYALIYAKIKFLVTFVKIQIQTIVQIQSQDQGTNILWH